jgi:uncharacterized protein YgiM (DUF1202 family)
MRAGCVIALVWLLAAPGAAAEQEFPYHAYVARDDCAIRSGPGRNYYATELLPLGETVEVYRHEDGWCAVRPKSASFSWVRADDLRIGRDGIGIVLTEGAASRVGTNESELRDVIQVRLERGEEVEVLDAVQVSNDNGVEFYCKIAPPSGEFRWIHKDDISREKPTAESVRRRAAGDDEVQSVDDEHEARADHWGSWVKSRRMGAHHAGGASAGESNPLRSDAQSSRSIALAAAADEDAGQSRITRERRPASRRGEGALASELRAIDRELSRIIVDEPGQWDFTSLRQRVKEAVAEAGNEEMRENVRDLQERIERFEDIRQRSLTLAGSASLSQQATGSTRVSESLSAGEPLRESQPRHVDESLRENPRHVVEALRDSNPRLGETRPRERDYDGVGKLTRVVSQRPGAPRYALVNSANEVVAFVSPGSGVNLQPFEGQHVGISGQRGYMPELKKSHVTALRVNVLGAPDRLARRR